MQSLSALSSFMINAGAVAGLVAAGAWWRAWSHATAADPVERVHNAGSERDAKLFTGLTLLLVSGGYLLGQFFGS